MTKHLEALHLYDPKDTFIELYRVRFPELTPRCAKGWDVNAIYSKFDFKQLERKAI